MNQAPKRKRRKKTKNNYFTQVHEDAILEYVASQCPRRKSELYQTLIGSALGEMVDKIVFTFKFTTLPNIDMLRDECKIWLVTILDKYNKDKGSKAFSYFSVVTKNWFIHKVKKTTKRLKTETPIDESKNLEHPLTDHIPYEHERARTEFFAHLRENIDEWYEAAEKENEVKVINAIKVLFEHSDQIEIFNKKAIYLYMREITDLNTKRIATVLTKLKVRYRGFKSDWNDGEI